VGLFSLLPTALDRNPRASLPHVCMHACAVCVLARHGKCWEPCNHAMHGGAGLTAVPHCCPVSWPADLLWGAWNSSLPRPASQRLRQFTLAARHHDHASAPAQSRNHGRRSASDCTRTRRGEGGGCCGARGEGGGCSCRARCCCRSRDGAGCSDGRGDSGCDRRGGGGGGCCCCCGGGGGRASCGRTPGGCSGDGGGRR
jgi:hypothetical protein